MNQYYIVSVIHTKRRDRYITLWRPNNANYAYPLPLAGKYDEKTVMANLGYYNQGCGSLAVPSEIIESLGVSPKPGMIDGNVGPVIPNTKKSWDKILVNLIADPRETPKPHYRGGPRWQLI